MSDWLAHPWMLVALVAAVLPWVIEWLFRRRVRQVELPSLRFLLGARKQDEVKRQDRWLLILRTAALVLLVLSLARPRIPQSWRGARRADEVVVILDATASMGRSAGASTAFHLARNQAVSLLKAIPSYVPARAALLTDHVQPLPAGTAADLAASLGDAGVSAAAGAMSEALAWAEQAGRGTVDVYVLSDFQKHNWRADPAGGDPAAILGRLALKGEITCQVQATTQAFHVQVTGFCPSDPLVVAGRPVRFTGTWET